MIDLTQELPKPIRPAFFTNVLNQGSVDIMDADQAEIEQLQTQYGITDTENEDDETGFGGPSDSSESDSGSDWQEESESGGEESSGTKTFIENVLDSFGDTSVAFLDGLAHYSIQERVSILAYFCISYLMLFGISELLYATLNINRAILMPTPLLIGMIIVVVGLTFTSYMNIKYLDVPSIKWVLAKFIKDKSILELASEPTLEDTYQEDSDVFENGEDGTDDSEEEKVATIEDDEEESLDFSDVVTLESLMSDDDDVQDEGLMRKTAKGGLVTSKNEKMSDDAFLSKLIGIFESETVYINSDSRDNVAKAFESYLFCTSPGYSVECEVPAKTTVYNNIVYLIFEGLRSLYRELTFDKAKIDVEKVTETKSFYKVIMTVPKIVKLSFVASNIRAIESKFKQDENDEAVDISVSGFGQTNTMVFKVAKLFGRPGVVSWADAINHIDQYGNSTFKKFFDKDNIIPIMVGLQNYEIPIFFDMAKNVHMVIPGSTGNGKSWGVNNIVFNIAAQFKPKDVSFMVMDFKGDAAYSIMAQLPHCVGLLNNSGEPQKFVEYMDFIRAEMEYRKILLNQLRVSNWVEARQKYANDPEVMDKLPWFIIIIEELSALLSELITIDKKVKDNFALLFQSVVRQCRAQGMRFILVSQRTTDADIPKGISTQCGTKLAYALSEPDAARIDLDKYEGKAPHGVGVALFKVESMTNPIFIKGLGIGGRNNIQANAIFRFMALEWHRLMSSEEVGINFEALADIDTRVSVHEAVMNDILNEDYLETKKFSTQGGIDFEAIKKAALDGQRVEHKMLTARERAESKNKPDKKKPTKAKKYDEYDDEEIQSSSEFYSRESEPDDEELEPVRMGRKEPKVVAENTKPRIMQESEYESPAKDYNSKNISNRAVQKNDNEEDLKSFLASLAYRDLAADDSDSRSNFEEIREFMKSRDGVVSCVTLETIFGEEMIKHALEDSIIFKTKNTYLL